MLGKIIVKKNKSDIQKLFLYIFEARPFIKITLLLLKIFKVWSVIFYINIFYN